MHKINENDDIYEIWVHISDILPFFNVSSSLDGGAKNRGTNLNLSLNDKKFS